jgi:hypothetical protein
MYNPVQQKHQFFPFKQTLAKGFTQREIVAYVVANAFRAVRKKVAVRDYAKFIIVLLNNITVILYCRPFRVIM